MINIGLARKYCNEDISLIDNYNEAINDSTSIWYCHHILEEQGFTQQELKDKNLYYKRPSSELRFMTSVEHNKLHHKGKKFSEDTKIKLSIAHKGIVPWNKGKHYKIGPMSNEHRAKLSGEKNGMYGKCAIKGKHKVWDNKELNLYHFEK